MILVSFSARLVYIQGSLLWVSEGSQGQSCSVRSPNQVLDIPLEARENLRSTYIALWQGVFGALRLNDEASPLLTLFAFMPDSLLYSLPATQDSFLWFPISLNIRWLWPHSICQNTLTPNFLESPKRNGPKLVCILELWKPFKNSNTQFTVQTI